MPLTIADVHSEISGNITRLRREKAFTQEQLAHEIKYSQAFINQIETGVKDCNIEQIYKIATALDCSIYQILPDFKLDLEDNHDD